MTVLNMKKPLVEWPGAEIRAMHVFPRSFTRRPDGNHRSGGYPGSLSRGYSCGTAPASHRSSPLRSLASGRGTPQRFYSVH